jgi:hypothetical protein
MNATGCLNTILFYRFSSSVEECRYVISYILILYFSILLHFYYTIYVNPYIKFACAAETCSICNAYV